MTLCKRSIINPVLVISIGLTALSGLFLMFHYESHFTKAIYQIGGIFLVIFVVMHLIINWKTLMVFLSGPFMLWTMVVFAVAVVIMTSTGDHVPHGIKMLQHVLR